MSRTHSRTPALRSPRRALARWLALAALVPLLAATGGCLGRRTTTISEAALFQRTILELLNEDESTPGYQQMRIRIQDMGPEVDAVLLALVRDRAVNGVVRANALTLLSERGAPGTLAVLERALQSDSPTRLRAAAIMGLQRLAPTMPDAARLIRGSVRDPARAVRLNALVALDVTDVETLRNVLQAERDREVRQVAMQLISIAESRGAPLAADPRGALRTMTANPLDPQLVFRPARADPATGMAVGDLRLEIPNAVDVPLTSTAEVAGGVVPAFFSTDHAKVVFETGGEIRVLDIPSRNIREVGAGIAPRVVPFAEYFLFLREEARAPAPGGEVVALTYGVFRAGFDGGDPERVGELRAEVRAEIADRYTPVRRMVIGETPEGLVLRGEGITPFPIPELALVPRSAPLAAR